MAKYTTVIIGAGPGGLACAKKLADADSSVIVLEMIPDIGVKTCAGGVTAKEIGSVVPKDALSRTFSKGFVYFGEKQNRVEIAVSEDTLATIERSVLGEYMAEKCTEAGAEVKLGTRVVEIAKDYVIDDEGNRYYFDFLVGADGSNSLVRKYLDIPITDIGATIQYTVSRNLSDIEIYFDLKNWGPHYHWIFPHENKTRIGTGSFDGAVPLKHVRSVFQKWLEFNKIDVSGSQLESHPINSDYKGFRFDNVFLVGDAAGFTDAFTGEGIYPAIVSGQEAARKILDSNYGLDKIQDLLQRKRRAEKPLRLYKKYTSLSQKYGNAVALQLVRTKRFQKKLINAFLY